MAKFWKINPPALMIRNRYCMQRKYYEMHPILQKRNILCWNGITYNFALFDPDAFCPFRSIATRIRTDWHSWLITFGNATLFDVPFRILAALFDAFRPWLVPIKILACIGKSFPVEQQGVRRSNPLELRGLETASFLKTCAAEVVHQYDFSFFIVLKRFLIDWADDNGTGKSIRCCQALVRMIIMGSSGVCIEFIRLALEGSK